MKLALLLFILGTAFVVSGSACRRVCYFKRTYYRVCNPLPCRTFLVIRYLCVNVGCGKRSIEENVEIGYPCNFAAYDTDNNGKIDRNEFKKTLRVANPMEVFKSFKTWDKNQDGVISCGEFLGSEHEFQCEPHGCEIDEAD